jgi:hypothetical protein
VRGYFDNMDAISFIAKIREEVPGFSPDSEDLRDGLTYCIINDLGRFICRKAGSASWDEVVQGVKFLEGIFAADEREAKALIGDCIWGLIECPSFVEIRALFSPKLKKFSDGFPPK